MLTQLTIYGQKRMAVVFDETVDAAQIASMRTTLSNLLTEVMTDGPQWDEASLRANVGNTLCMIEAMGINTEQAQAINAMLDFGDEGQRRCKAVTRECTITF